MKIDVKKEVTICLSGKEARLFKTLFGNMTFGSYLDLIGDIRDAEDAQHLGGLIYDTLNGEGF